MDVYYQEAREGRAVRDPFITNDLMIDQYGTDLHASQDIDREVGLIDPNKQNENS